MKRIRKGGFLYITKYLPLPPRIHLTFHPLEIPTHHHYSHDTLFTHLHSKVRVSLFFFLITELLYLYFQLKDFTVSPFSFQPLHHSLLSHCDPISSYQHFRPSFPSSSTFPQLSSSSFRKPVRIIPSGYKSVGQRHNN